MASPQRPPVILVSGAVGQEFVYWNLLRRRLRRDGFDPYTVTFPRFTMQDLRLSAELLASRVEVVRAETGAEKVSLVCHSMGGLIARWWMRRLGGVGRTASVVFLGTPHLGTVAGLSGLPFRGARQIVPGSPFLNELNQGEDAAAVPTTNVWSFTDFVIVPSTNARLDRSGVEEVQLTFVGHWGMLVSRAAYRHVVRGLRRAKAP
ncbi:MAG TPA: lipase [Candidatus Thermoplasmatota archaeon]|nr:lipase [Candidatus Thermoplasmatota archaeon]